MKKISKKKEEKILKTIQEFQWFIESHKDITLIDIMDLLSMYHEERRPSNNKRQSLHSDTQFLVGVLPQIFQDTDLFPKKDDILEFAKQVLGIKLNIQAKRSRIEYIGTILCMVSNAKSSNLDNLVNALDQMINDEKTMKDVKLKRKEPNFSWNETISKLQLL